jgi:hypothetical protein
MSESTVSVYTRITVQMRDRLLRLAAADKRSAASLARVLLEEAIERRDADQGDRK